MLKKRFNLNEYLVYRIKLEFLVALCYNINMKQNEKRVPHYNLEKIKKLIENKKYIITKIAQDNARIDFDLGIKDIIKYITALDNTCFYKSMTSIYDNKIWQDVYHLNINKDTAYIKLQIVSENSVIIQFKRK